MDVVMRACAGVMHGHGGYDGGRAFMRAFLCCNVYSKTPLHPNLAVDGDVDAGGVGLRVFVRESGSRR